MKLLLSLILIISLISTCYSQSSSSSSEECSQYCSGPSCSICVPHVSNYYAVPPSGGGIYLLGIFGNDYNGLTVKVGGQDCQITWSISGRIDCIIGPLNLYEFYDIEISNSNGLILLQEDFYSPRIDDCGHGYFYLGRCVCDDTYEGQLCNIEKPPYVSSITSSSVDGGLVQGYGWFGETPQNFLFFIGNDQLRIQDIYHNQFVGYAPPGTGINDLTIVDASNNQLLFTGSNLYSYDSNKCFNNCFNNGVCNNGVCTCYYPWIGDYCSHTKDSTCQCTNI